MDVSPLVSIVIPTFNDGPVLSQAIDCSLNQTYKNIEIIIVDDGSSDNTEQILREKYSGRVIYVRQENKGPGSARNTGVRYSSGKYVQFLDADDLLDPDKIRIQVELLRDIPETALSYSDYVYCDMNDSTVTYGHRYICPRLQEENPFDDILMKWETGLSIPMHSFLFDTAIFKDHAISFDEKLLTNEDWDCWMDVFALKPEVVYVDKVLAFYRIRSGSRCSNRLKMRKGYLKAIHKQIVKNRLNDSVVEKLTIRKKQIKHLYRDVSLLARVMNKCPRIIRKLYREFVPWRLQKLLDVQQVP